MELWDLYTAGRQKTGETHVRGVPLPPGRYHVVVHVWIRRRDGLWLISQRAATRPTFPLMWECTGGAVTAGETSLQAAVREAMEEVGVQLDPASGRLVSSAIREKYRNFRDVWVFPYDGPLDLSAATTDEVADMHWMTAEEIRQLQQQGLWVENLNYFFTDPELGGSA